MTGEAMIGDRCGGMIATGMPGCMPQSDHEKVAAEPKSFTGQYSCPEPSRRMRPLLERTSRSEGKGPKGRSKVAARAQPDFIAAK